jgi:hypothetical protein
MVVWHCPQAGLDVVICNPQVASLGLHKLALAAVQRCNRTSHRRIGSESEP